MDFTREPVIETIITPREGFRLVVRRSSVPSAEEFIVDAVEVVVFGSTCFYRSIERIKPFLLPMSEYEIVEIREPRMALKMASFVALSNIPS